MRPLFAAVTALAVITISCNHANQPDFSRITDPYERWKAYNLRNYSIDQARYCFCPDGGQTMRMTVRSGVATSVVRLSDSADVMNASAYLTVDSLFATIRSHAGDSLVVTYNMKYGYPESLDIEPQLHPVDGGVLYQTSNLKIQ